MQTKRKSATILGIVLVGILVVAVLLYYYVADGVGEIQPIEGFRVELEQSNYEDDLPTLMVNEYLKQYQKWYLPRKQRIHDVVVQHVEQFDDEVVSIDFLQQNQTERMDSSDAFYHTEKSCTCKVIQIDFTVDTPVTSNETMAFNLDGNVNVDNKKQIQVQWVLFYEVKEQIKEDGTSSATMFVWRELRPAAYDLMNYNTSGQAEADRIQAEKEQQEAQLTRDDEGKAIGQLDGTIFWVNQQVGYDARQEDKAMSQEYRCIYRTENGGSTWEAVGPTPSNWILQSYAFVTEELGFFTYPKIEGEQTNFYRTEDGGNSFEAIMLPKITVTVDGYSYEPFTMPNHPWEEDGILYMYLEQGSDGDYQGGKVRAIIKSEDQGKNWVDTGRIDQGER